LVSGSCCSTRSLRPSLPEFAVRLVQLGEYLRRSTINRRELGLEVVQHLGYAARGTYSISSFGDGLQRLPGRRRNELEVAAPT